jgi:glycosyltransferase involved in cell wall biosynthesis
VSVGFPAALANVFLRKKLVVKVVGDHVWEQGRQRFGVSQSLEDFPLRNRAWPWYLNFLRTIQLYTLSKATLIIVPSEYLKKILTGWGIPSEKAIRIYNGVDFNCKPILPTTPPLHLIVTSARLVPWKGVTALIDLVITEPLWNLVIVGDGPMRKELQIQVEEKGLGGRIRFLGTLSHEQALGWYKVADVFVLNSSYEGLSHTLLEAMYLGAPIVATDVGGNPELIAKDISGVLVAAGDTLALKQNIQKIMDDRDFAQKIGKAASLRAEDFSTKRTIDMLSATLKKYA